MTIRAMIPAESPTASSTVSLALTKLLEPSLTLTFLGERLLVSPLNLKPWSTGSSWSSLNSYSNSWQKMAGEIKRIKIVIAPVFILLSGNPFFRFQNSIQFLRKLILFQFSSKFELSQDSWKLILWETDLTENQFFFQVFAFLYFVSGSVYKQNFLWKSKYRKRASINRS